MAKAEQIIELLKSHISGDERRFYAIAMQVAAHEAKQGHEKVAQELKKLIDKAKEKRTVLTTASTPKTTGIAKPSYASSAKRSRLNSRRSLKRWSLTNKPEPGAKHAITNQQANSA